MEKIHSSVFHNVQRRNEEKILSKHCNSLTACVRTLRRTHSHSYSYNTAHNRLEKIKSRQSIRSSSLSLFLFFSLSLFLFLSFSLSFSLAPFLSFSLYPSVCLPAYLVAPARLRPPVGPLGLALFGRGCQGRVCLAAKGAHGGKG